LPARCSGCRGPIADDRALRDRALAALRTVDCADAARRLPGTLPYAVQKRVAPARALVAQPDLLLLDEPSPPRGWTPPSSPR